MGKGTQTRAVILQAAVETACVSGFQGLNLQPLADRVGMTKSGLYAHFGSKEALQLATVEAATALFEATVLVPCKQDAAGLPRLRGLLSRWLAWPMNAGLAGRCPFVVGAIALPPGDPALSSRLVRLFSDFTQMIETLAASAVRHGHLPAHMDLALFAHQVIALRHAHLWATGLMQDPEADARTWAAFDHLIQL
jgi:AcrR family transcriptional regulator